jgi:uncharacterized protein (TIGR02246 family)
MRNAMTKEELLKFAAGYAAAWSGRVPGRVAEHFEPEGGTLTINDGESRVGRQAIAAAAEEFMTELPDLVVEMDALEFEGDRVVFRWTLHGTYLGGPDANGNSVRVSGSEKWRMSGSGLIADSIGAFDADDYVRQLGGGDASA